MSTQYTEFSVANRQFSWPGIFSGTFLFLAIEATFGMLGVAIFVSAVSHAANPANRGIGIGAGIWTVVLSIIAFYFAGKLASTYSATTTRNAGMYAGLVTYGMSVFTTLLIGAFMVGNPVTPGVSGYPLNVLDFIVAGGYWLFAAMFLGMIAAASGGIHGAMTSGLRRTVERSSDTATTKRVA